MDSVGKFPLVITVFTGIIPNGEFFKRGCVVVPASRTSSTLRGKEKEKAASGLLKLAFHWKDAEGRSVQLLAFQYSICKNIFSLISVCMS